jgi:CheY-like chemotaxis protein
VENPGLKEDSLPNRTILFADDSATMRAIMEKTFAAEPYEVVAVPSGEAALAKAREISPSIVIADAGMPGMTGYDVCKALRDEGSLKGTPVIIMSGVSSPYDEARGREVGADEHVKKPFDTTKLIEKVGELTAGAPAAEAPAAAAPAPVEEAPAAPAEPAPAEPAPAPPQPPIARSRPVALGGPPAAGMPKAPGKTPHKETMIFGAEAGKPPAPVEPEPVAAPDVKPIEIDTETPAEGDFQVGTLAELAQMDDKGAPVAPDVAGSEIELDEPGEPAPPPPAETAVKQEAAAAADDVAAKLGGDLTPEQVEAVRALTAEVVERVVWEVVPDLAEAMIREQIDKLLEE